MKIEDLGPAILVRNQRFW